ncbi:MAG: amidohydrolase [Gemmataceae bacterium]|nr:amidohydrolase [Gemmataceae bacterium]
MNYIDAHCHVWTSDTGHYPLAPGWKPADMQPRRFTPEDLFKHTRPAGVNRLVLIQMSYYYPREPSSEKVTQFDNRYMLDMMALHKDTFAGTAVIDPHAKNPDREMTRLAKQRVRAFRIHPRLSKLPPPRWLEPPGYQAMFAAGAKHNLAMSCLIDPDALPELDRMCKRYPDTPVIIDHLCRIGVDGTIRDADVKALCAMAAHQRVMVKIGAFYALGNKQAPYTDLGPMIQAVVKAFTPRRCMWESDCPFQVQNGHTYRASIDLVRTRLAFLTNEDKDWLLRRTAEEFFFRPQN